MISSINSALSGLHAQQWLVRTAAGNLANLNTPGFKRLGSIGQNGYRPGAASGVPPAGLPGTGGAGPVTQGALEGARVDATREIVNLMLGQRGLEASLKVIQTTDSLVGELVDLRA